MACYLPAKASLYIDPTCAITSIKSLASAVEAGEIDLSALLSYTNEIGKHRVPKISKTSPIPTSMLEAIKASPDVPPRKIVYAGVVDGLWSMEDAEAYEANAEILKHRVRRPASLRGAYLTRNRRTVKSKIKTDGRFVPKMAMQVYAVDSLCDGAVKCLGILMSLAGKSDRVTTYTSSIAATMQRTTRTVRNYFAALEEARLITRRPGKLYNTVEIVIDPVCRPEPYKEPRDIKAFKLARVSRDPGLHLMAMSVVIASLEAHPESFATSDRRKEIAMFNQESNILRGRHLTLEHQNPCVIRRPQTVSSFFCPPTSHSTLLHDPRKPNRHQRGKVWQ